jgi:hypothetical protein
VSETIQHELAVVPHSARMPDGRSVRLMPLADSILWSPAVGGTHRPAPLMFFAQHTLRKIHDRLATLPNGLGIGLLAGRRYVDNRSGAQFVIIDGALPLPVLAAEDDATDALAQGLSGAAAGIEVVGWYRSHSFSDAALTASDVEAQTELFADNASVVLVVAAAGEAGAVFRRSASPAWPVEALPFYEWLAEPAKTEGAKPTILNWRNYRAAESVTPLGAAPLTAAADLRINNRPVLVPDIDPDEDPAPQPIVVGAKPQWHRSLLRPALYGAAALAGAILVGAVSALRGGSDGAAGSRAGIGGSDPAGTGSAALVTAVLDRRADTLSLALTAFDDRARMFDAKQMTCAGLSRGLQQVEDSWLSYNMARRDVLAPFDGQREGRDRELYADVRSVERRFERSGCERP